MKPKLDLRTGKLGIELEEKDFYDAIQIEEMTKGHFQCRKCGEGFKSEGWKILQGYMKNCRELFIEAGKDGTRTRAKRDLSDLKFATIDGFDTAINLAQRIIDRANLVKDAVKQKENISNEANDE